MYAMAAHGQALRGTFLRVGQWWPSRLWALPAAICLLRQEQDRDGARAAASAEQRIIKPHFLTAHPCQSQLPLGLFDAKPDIFIYICF